MPSTLGIVSSGYYDRPMWVVVGASASDYLNAYPINPYTGWGTKVTAPTSSPPAESQTHVGWNYTNTVVATCANTATDSLRLNAWAWSAGSWGTKFSAPSTITSATHRFPKFNPQNTDVITSIGTAGNTTTDTYAWSSGWGTRYTSPTFTNGQNAGEFVLNGTAVIYGIISNTAPLVAYPFTSGTGYGTKFADPATLPTGQGGYIAWDENTSSVITSQQNVSPYINAYPFTSSGWGTRFTITSAFTTASNDIAFDKRGQSAFFLQSTPTRRAWSASGFGSNLTSPSSPLTTGTGLTIAVSPDNSIFVQTSNGVSPYIKAWPIRSSTTMGTAFSNPASASFSTTQWAEISN
jgi:hypothetical protein